MRGVTDARGLGDLRTAITTRVHSKPPQKGTAHLDLYLLSKEKQRLEKEMERLEQRQRRIQEHLAEIGKAVAKLEQEAQPQNSSGASAPEPAPSHSPPAWGHRLWKRMAIDY